MSWLSEIFGGGVKGVIDGVGEVVDRFIETDDEKRVARMAMEKIITERMQMMEDATAARVGAQMEVMVAELKHGDEYVKHTRPMLIRWGLYIIALNYVLLPWVTRFGGLTLDPIVLPTEFWWAWGGAVSVYALGRSAEKMGATSPIVQAITGNKK